MEKVSKDNSLNISNRTHVIEKNSIDWAYWERPVLQFVIFLVVLISISDSWEDYTQGGNALSILADLVYMTLMICGLLYLWKMAPLSLRKTNRVLQQEISSRNQEAAQWQERSKQLMAGLRQMVTEQFAEWGLSGAEKEVALLLLKGLSHKEIADIRNTSSRTVRQQATALYQKANLSGRAELSAFFLEDLWLPDEDKTAT